MRRFLCIGVIALTGFAGVACGSDNNAQPAATTSTTRLEDTAGGQAVIEAIQRAEAKQAAEERAARRDREICLNPLRRCSSMTPTDWALARAEWEAAHP